MKPGDVGLHVGVLERAFDDRRPFCDDPQRPLRDVLLQSRRPLGRQRRVFFRFVGLLRPPGVWLRLRASLGLLSGQPAGADKQGQGGNGEAKGRVEE